MERKELGSEPTASPDRDPDFRRETRPAGSRTPSTGKLEGILDAIAFGATRIGTFGPWQRDIRELLKRLGQAAGVSRVTLFEVHEDCAGRPVESCRFDWAEPGLAQLSSDRRYRNMPITDDHGAGLDDWSLRRARGEVVQARLSETVGYTRQVFEEHGTLAFISVPVFVGTRWWGFVGFDDCRRERIWGELEVHILRIAAAVIGGAIGRAEAERELRSSQQRYALAALGANDGLWEWDIQGERAYLSRQCRRILGLRGASDSEAIEQLRRDMWPGQGGRLDDYFATCFAERRRRFEVECRWQAMETATSDAPTWFVVRGIILYAIGKPSRLVGSLRDITDRKRAQLEVERKEYLLRAVVDSVPAVINVKDRESRYLLMNRYQGEVYGCDPEHAIGLTSSDLVGEAYGGRSRDYDQEVLEKGLALPFTEREFIDVRGRPHTWYTAKTPWFDPEAPGGQPAGVITVALDVSDLKAAERARANLSRYVAPALVDLMASAKQPFGPPRQQNAAVLFADVVNFTRISETAPPDAVFSLLREFHEQAARAVFDTGGTLIKFTGDGIMATFGLPQTASGDAANALQCARRLKATVDGMNARQSRPSLLHFRVAIGVHYGPVLIGALGSDRRTEVAVVGDTVNVANRLERLLRSVRSDIAISQDLVEAIDCGTEGGALRRDELLQGFQPLPPRRLRGRQESTKVWILAPEIRDVAKSGDPTCLATIAVAESGSIERER